MYKIVIQARLGSTRLKNKMILPFHGERKLIEVILHNLLEDFDPSEIVLATSNLPENKTLGDIASQLGITVYYGSENDVLSRFIEVGEKYNLDYVIRICADNPLIKNETIKELISNYENQDYIAYFYSDNTPSIKTHSGFFTELVSVKSLQKIKELTDDNFYYEHVTNYIYGNDNIFNIKKLNIQNEEDIRNIRLTIDDVNDFDLTKTIYQRYVDFNGDLHYTDIVSKLITHEEKDLMIKQINKNIK